MKVSDFDYTLPKELIAQEPVLKRDYSRLLVVDRAKGTLKHRNFFNIVDHLSPGDLLVLNDTRVIPANIAGVKEEGGAKVEVLLAKHLKGKIWECLVKPGKRLKVGSRVIFENGLLMGKVLEKKETGEQIIEFKAQGKFNEIINRLGQIPLPPYICYQKKLEPKYQTIYAKKPGASAAPTAGLHFTPELLEKLKEKGVKIAFITLHTGLATFRPVYTENVEEHKMYKESFYVPKETIDAIKEAKRVIAVGTTTVRTLETIAQGKMDSAVYGETGLFIYPGFKFKLVDAMITNFHFPRSTLLMMVSAFAKAPADRSAFAGRDLIFKAYQEAIREEYRFFSFGDAMFIK